jgi:uncharacterized membrane protein
MAAKTSVHRKPVAKPKLHQLKETLDDEIRSNIGKILALEEQQRAQRSAGEKVSEWIAKFCGSMAFVYVHIAWFGGWIVANTLLPAPFDPFPYTFLTLVVSLEAIFLSTFILISQNHETQLTERRDQLDLQINMVAEKENTKILELLEAIAVKVGIDYDDESLKPLLAPIDPEDLTNQIASASEDANKKAEKKIDEKVEEKTEQKTEEKVEQKLDEKVDKKVGEKVAKATKSNEAKTK